MNLWTLSVLIGATILFGPRRMAAAAEINNGDIVACERLAGADNVTELGPDSTLSNNKTVTGTAGVDTIIVYHGTAVGCDSGSLGAFTYGGSNRITAAAGTTPSRLGLAP